ncbi:hypothetical protein [Metabacillus fastidiosus]|uniref:hypothetical protein n=1 Tax=Metabacillus fastidiosus TaxID=1458 RepID=UPI003D27B5DB
MRDIQSDYKGKAKDLRFCLIIDLHFDRVEVAGSNPVGVINVQNRKSKGAEVSNGEYKAKLKAPEQMTSIDKKLEMYSVITKVNLIIIQ